MLMRGTLIQSVWFQLEQEKAVLLDNLGKFI